MSYRFWIGVAGLLGALAVAAGAAGAHALTGYSPQAQKLFDVAQRYHMIHALALFAVAWVIWLDQRRARGYNWLARLAAHAFLGGMILFSGILYWEALTGLYPRLPLVPVGGTLFIIGWVALALSAFLLPKATANPSRCEDE